MLARRKSEMKAGMTKLPATLEGREEMTQEAKHKFLTYPDMCRRS